MKNACIYFFSFLFISCFSEKLDTKKLKTSKVQVEIPEFQSIIDAAQVSGSILIYDLQKNRYYSNNFKWIENAYLPASTFKIPNSIIALETGVVKNDSSVFKWNGEKRNMKIWEQDLIFKDAFQFSCVPCYQEVARTIGAVKMNQYLDTLNYGEMEVTENNIDLFWLEGNSKITQLQQIDFLKRLYLSQLPISKRTESIIKRMLLIEKKESYSLSGKTGWSIRNGNNNGWFVGYLESNEQIFFFATNIVPEKQFDMTMFPKIRKEITHKAFQHLGVIK